MKLISKTVVDLIIAHPDDSPVKAIIRYESTSSGTYHYTPVYDSEEINEVILPAMMDNPIVYWERN